MENGKYNDMDASRFGEVCKRKESTGYRTLTTRVLYSKLREAKAMRYGLTNESVARTDNTLIMSQNNHSFHATETGLHIVKSDYWLAASPDGLVTDPSSSDPNGLIEIKCPFLAESSSLQDICTTKKHKFSFCLT